MYYSLVLFPQKTFSTLVIYSIYLYFATCAFPKLPIKPQFCSHYNDNRHCQNKYKNIENYFLAFAAKTHAEDDFVGLFYFFIGSFNLW